MTMVKCSNGYCQAKNRNVDEGWVCPACRRALGISISACRSKVKGHEIKVTLMTEPGERRQNALFVLAAHGIQQTVVAHRHMLTVLKVNQVLNGATKPTEMVVDAVLKTLKDAGHEYDADELFYWGLPDTT